MSLFKSRDIWSYQCGNDETFDTSSVVVADIRNRGEDCIVVGSHAGYLRILQPQADADSDSLDFKPTDLFIEIQLENPILQVAVGKLVSGSPNNHLGVLHPYSISVYSLHTLTGSAQHGDQCHLVLAYEHQLKKSAYSLVIGPFGGSKGRDFICVQSLDGTLSFYEQETFAGNCSLPCFLLPSKIVYIQQSDSFVTLNSNWYLESFRYDVLADSSGRKLAPSWSFNLGESVVDMCIITLMGSEAALLVLGERNVYWFRDSGGLKIMKRLQYNACCFHIYVTEPDRRLMMLVVSDTATLLVYHETTLMWSSQLSFVPVSICRVNFRSLNGIIMSLSESGAIQCSYLGTEPSVFMAPPLDKKLHSYEELQQKLADLQHDIDIHTQGNLIPLSVTTGHDLSISAHIVLIQSDPPVCRLELLLSPTAPISSVQVSINVDLPLKATPLTHHLASLCEQIYIESVVSFDMCYTVPLATLDITVVTVYLTGGQTPRVLQTTVPLPLAFAVKPVTPFKEATHKITISVSQSVVPLSQLFSEFTGETWSSVGCSDNAVGFGLTNLPELVVTLITSKSSSRYRAQSESVSAMCLIISQLVCRIESHHASKHKQVLVTFQASALPLPSLLSTVDAHTSLRSQLNVLQEDLKMETSQYRAIQRRLLAKLRDKTPTPLSSLDKLLKSSYNHIVESIRKYEDIQMSLELCNCELSCIVRLILLLAKLAETTSIPDLSDLAAALAYTHHQATDQGWEEVCESGITYLLRTSLAKSVRDQQRTNVTAIKDVARFKRHIAAALDRVVTGNQNKLKEDNRAVSPILEGDEEAMSAHGSRRQSVEGLGRLKLLPTRKSVQVNVPPTVPSGSGEEASSLLDDDELPW